MGGRGFQVAETAGAKTWLAVGMYRPSKGRDGNPVWLRLALSSALGILEVIGVEACMVGWGHNSFVNPKTHRDGQNIPQKVI